jgi:Cu/Ag efflux protein CusF
VVLRSVKIIKNLKMSKSRMPLSTKDKQLIESLKKSHEVEFLFFIDIPQKKCKQHG